MAILDEFTNLPISRQRKYQLRMQRDQRCTECGEPVGGPFGSRCIKHLIKARERQRKKPGLKRRYRNTLSYRMEAAALRTKPKNLKLQPVVTLAHPTSQLLTAKH